MSAPPPADAAAVRMPGTEFVRDGSTRLKEIGFAALLLTALGIALLTLLVLLIDVIVEGAGSLSPEFFTETPSRVDPSSSGIAPAILGTLWLMFVCAAFIIPVGVASSIYLEEYSSRESRFARFVELNIQNLAAVPSIVYGVLGLAFLVRGPLSLGNVVLAGGLTPGTAGLAGGDRHRARGAPRRPAVHPRGLDGPRGDQVADDLEAGPAGSDPGNGHGHDPGAVPRDR